MVNQSRRLAKKHTGAPVTKSFLTLSKLLHLHFLGSHSSLATSDQYHYGGSASSSRVIISQQCFCVLSLSCSQTSLFESVTDQTLFFLATDTLAQRPTTLKTPSGAWAWPEILWALFPRASRWAGTGTRSARSLGQSRMA